MKSFRRSSFRLTPCSLFVVLISLSPLLLVIPTAVNAQWEPDIRLTFNDSASYTSWNNARCIATGLGGHVFVVWYDKRDGDEEIYYKRSSDDGVSWDTVDTRLTKAPGLSEYPSLAVSDSTIHIVWSDYRDGVRSEVYYKRSTDLGLTWNPDIRLTYDTCSSWFPSVASSGLFVHVAWMDKPFITQRAEIFYLRSTDGGASWLPDIQLTFDSSYSQIPAVSVADSIVHVAWQGRRDGNEEIYYKRSTNGGASWLPHTRLTYDTSRSYSAAIAALGSSVHVVWYDMRGWNWDIYYKRSTDDGATWTPDIRLTDDLGGSYFPTVVPSGNNIHVVWEDNRDGDYELYYKRSTDEGETWSTDERLTNDLGYSYFPSVAVSGTKVHVVWQDDRHRANYPEIYYKRNPTGNPSSVDEKPDHKEQRLEVRFRAKPNPFTSFTTLPGHASERFGLYDISGRRVGTYKGDRIGEGLSAGVYFLRPFGGNAKPLRIVKLR